MCLCCCNAYEELYGSIDAVKEIVNDNPRGTKQQHSLPLYVVDDFLEFTLHRVFIIGPCITYVLIPFTTYKCEMKCRNIITISLRIYKAITIMNAKE